MVMVRAFCKRNQTGQQMVAGRKYNFSAKGWGVDWYIPCGPNGYNSPVDWLVRRFKRCPEANLFKLIGSVGSDDSYLFEIGSELKEYEAKKTGELICFANDFDWLFWNNWGALDLTVEEAVVLDAKHT
jgi:hypothetical protein